jgi:ubiquinone/menaquinone biosynthesis C-methylase UbiE
VAAERGASNVRFARMDAEALDVSDGSFDVAVSALGILYCPDPLAACREMFRALRAGGRMAAAVWGERRRCGWAEVFPIVESRVKSDVCPLFFQLGSGDALRLTMAHAGFQDVRLERIPTVLSYDSADDAIGAVFAGGPVALAYSRFDDATRSAAHAEYLASIAAFRHGDGYRVPGEFVVAAGIRV